MSKRAFIGVYSAALLSGVCFAAEGSGGGSGSDDKDKIRQALRKLDPDNDDDWTQGGLPAMARVQELSGMSGLNRQQVGEADPGYNREKAAGTPEPKANVEASHRKQRENADAASGATGGAGSGENGEQTAEDRIQPNLDPASNPNVGTTDLGPYEGQAHTADQRENLHAQEATEEAGEIQASEGDNPIELFERAVAAAQTDRYRRNGELQNLVRHYQVNQVAIKDLQGRLDKRNEDRASRSTS